MTRPTIRVAMKVPVWDASDMRPPRTLSQLVRHHRLGADLTLEALSEVSGISARTISDIERGVSSAPQSRTVAALAAALGLGEHDREEFLRAARSRKRAKEVIARTLAGSPHRVLDFSGREYEIAAVLDFLAVDAAHPPSSALLLSGPPGIGKTTSALEATVRPHSGPSEVIFVDLDGFSAAPLSPLQVLQAVLRQMPDVGDKAPADLEAAIRLWRTVSAEHPRAVVLDNAALESQVRPVLSADGNSRVVITSRRSLAGLEGISRVALGPLDQHESIQLLERLIPAGQRHRGGLEELAELSDHIPLALRIVGNRIASRPEWQAMDFVERMRSRENRLHLLVAGDLAVETAFALSYDDLEARTAALFRSISVIDGSTFDARIAAATAGIDVLDADSRLEELTDLGLVESRGGSRYRVHDLIRLYASERLTNDNGERGGRDERDRLRSWMLASLERAGAWFEPNRTPATPTPIGASFPDAATAQAWIRLEEPHWWPALKSAAALGEHELVSDVADSLHWFSELWVEWGHWTELFALAVTSARALNNHRLEAMHLGYQVWSVVVESADTAEGVRLAELAVTAAIASADPSQLGWSKFYAGWLYFRADRIDESTRTTLESIAHFESIGEYVGIAQSMSVLSILQSDQEGHERSIVALRRIAERLDENVVETSDIAMLTSRFVVHKFLAASYIALDQFEDALAASTVAVNMAKEFTWGVRLAIAYSHRARAYLALGQFDAANHDIASALSNLDDKTTNATIAREREVLEYLKENSENRNRVKELPFPY
jgi:transcriptional regulator with XRE-family HTH domain/tetratricopeptide (TPR) repeat protein